MSAHPPPVPPEQRNDEIPGTPEAATSERAPPGYQPQQRNLGEQGRQGNIKQNTTNKGHQQDR